ncbi:MAG: SPFH domain-containing protein [Prevotella sp.]|jgi:regulator of protease activity HflC (stomatin/prohibitin superfamily)
MENKENTPKTSIEGKEHEFKGFMVNGFLAFFIILTFTVICVAGLVHSIDMEEVPSSILNTVLTLCFLFCLKGFIRQEPNEARVMMFFGKYIGTFKKVGFYWVNPFIDTKKLSMRARNLDAKPIKVNDKQGNPVMIGLVVVWKLKDTYKAMFEIDSQTMAGPAIGTSMTNIMNAFENFVQIQSDAALRQVAGQYAYDNNGNSDDLTLRGGGDEINHELEIKLDERLDMAGIKIVEARINYLAYAPEIAAVMLRRQQADAVIAAREKIVEGAVGMVKMALTKLADEEVVELDDDKKAAMVSNLMVVLCGDDTAQPVVNAGTLNT